MKYLILMLFFISLPTRAESLPEYCPKAMTIVYYGNWYPYMFLQDGHFKGIDYEFLMKIANKINCLIVVNSLPERRAHKELAHGNSLVMSGATITEERQKYAYFSKPYRAEIMSLFYLNKDQHNERSIDEIFQQSKMIAINAAAYYGPLVENYRQSTIAKKFNHVPSLERRIAMIERKRAEAMVEDHIAGCYYLHKSRAITMEDISWHQVNHTDVAFMFSKVAVTKAFIAIFNQTMQQLIEQGVYDEIVAKYTPKGC